MKPKLSKKVLLGAKVETVSTNTLDNKLRIEVAGKWWIETQNPNEVFGTGYVHKLKQP